MENTNCYIFAFATFGHPNDFRQTPFKYGNSEIAKQVKVFDLSNAIKVFPKSTIYSIRKERINSSILISYSIYSFAQERTSKRDGTFIGSSIILENAIADEIYVLNCLNEFHQKLTENNLNNGILKVNHSDDFKEMDNLNDFDKIKNPQIEIQNLNFNTHKNSIVVYCDTTPIKLASFYKKSIDLLNVYDTIYFTSSDEVAKYVLQKGIFKLIQHVGEKLEFDREIDNLVEERKRKRELSISEFEREVKRINDDKISTIRDFKNHIDQFERTHIDNERKLKESKDDLNKIGTFYDDFLTKTKNLTNQLLHNNKKLEEVKQIHNDNKILFNTGIRQLKIPNYTTTIAIAKPQPKANLQIEYQRHEIEQKTGHARREKSQDNDYKINKYKLATLILTFIIICTWACFLLFKYNSEDETEISQNQEQINTVPRIQEIVDTTKIEELNPKPNSRLNKNDYIIVAKKIKPNMILVDVVKVIFNNNPTEISSIYSSQVAIYSKNLLELNKQCFTEKKGIYYFAKDTLRQIPAYKK